MQNINLKTFQKNFQKFMNTVIKTGDTNVDKQTFTKKVTKDISIFNMLDRNRDGKVSQDEIETVLQADSDNDGMVTENELICMQQMKFFAKRGIDKWFSLDIDRDGHRSSVEDKLGDHRMWGDASTYTGLDAAMTNEQLAKLYNMKEIIDDSQYETLENWMNLEIDDLIQDAKKMFGIELNEKQITVLKNEQKKQLNTWLFKTGDNATENAPLYNSLNNTAYTRLITTEQKDSCCGGDIIPPPATNDKSYCSEVFNGLEYTKEQFSIKDKINELQSKFKIGKITEKKFYKTVKSLYKNFRSTENVEAIDNLHLQFKNEEISRDEFVEKAVKLFELSNSSEEVKNRLAWAMYPMSPELKEIKEEIDNEFQAKIDAKEITQEEAKEQKKEISVWERMSDESYRKHHEHYQQLRDMKASDFRELLKPENEQKRIEFEKISSMTVQQIVDYINIVEQKIGAGNFDNDNWSVSAEQYFQIVLGINGTVGDEDKLQGKTRADVPENRQALLRFLEENGWLYEQFKQ